VTLLGEVTVQVVIVGERDVVEVAAATTTGRVD